MYTLCPWDRLILFFSMSMHTVNGQEKPKIQNCFYFSLATKHHHKAAHRFIVDG